MKLPLCFLLALGVCGGLFAADEKPAAQFKDTRDKISYSIGVQVGGSIKAQGADLDVDLDQVMAGMRDALGGKAKLTDLEVRETITAWQKDLRDKRTEKQRAAGDAWLAENAKKPGVKTMPDGLQYKVLVSGKGPQPKPGDTVSAHYKGTLTDGTEFDSSYSRGQPLTIPVLGVIAGWQEALTNMHVGDKWELYIPSQLAYGERGSPPKIAPHSALVFEMELLGIEAPKPNTPAPGAGNPGFPSLRPAPGSSPTPQIKVQPAPK